MSVGLAFFYLFLAVCAAPLLFSYLMFFVDVYRGLISRTFFARWVLFTAFFGLLAFNAAPYFHVATFAPAGDPAMAQLSILLAFNTAEPRQYLSVATFAVLMIVPTFAWWGSLQKRAK